MKYFLLFALIAFSTQAKALDLPIVPAVDVANTGAISTSAAPYNFDGIIALSNCSGSIIKLEGMSDSDKAYILTNGHCLVGGFLAHGQHVYKQPIKRTINVLNSMGQSQGYIYAFEIAYATMTNTDLALYRVNETYAEIYNKFKVTPFILDSQKPVPGTQIDIISGYWRRGYSCGLEAIIPELHEDQWRFKEALRYSTPGCNIVGGTSGSPVIKSGAKIVIGVNNTYNEAGRSCTMNNPCEVDENGQKSIIRGRGYGQQTYNVYSCLNANFDIDLSIPGCSLPQ